MKIATQNLLLMAVFVLLILGLIMVYSSSATMASANYHDSIYFLKRQLIYVLLGVGALVIGNNIDPDLYRHVSYPFYFFAITLLILVLIPGIGKTAGGAARWISLGFMRLQPAEIFKLALVVYLAMSLAKKGNRMLLFRVGIIPHLVLPGVAMLLLMLEPDFGSTFIVATITFVMLFVGGARIAYLLGAMLVAIPVAIQIIASSPYRLERIVAFLDPWSHRQNEGYQVVESLMTLGSGGFFGLGLGAGVGKLHFLPAAHTDFILSVIGEELGFIGITLVMACFLGIGWCGFRIALRLHDPFKAYLATGITTLLVLQAIINSFVVMGLAPTKGITLPFVSFGGSSLIMSCFMAGILLRLSRELAHKEVNS